MSRANCTIIPKGTFERKICDCCAAHDADYIEQIMTRKEADIQFRKCVTKKTNKLVAWILYTGIRIGGWYFWYRRRLKNRVK